MNRKRVLVILLRSIAVAAMLAVVPVFMPHAWMDVCHRRLGLGPLPEQPIIVYLTRSLSAMYVFHGGVLWIIAGDMKRYAALLTYVAAAFVAFGVVTLWIDIRAGLPWLWTASEGPFGVVVGLAIFALSDRRQGADQ